MQDYECNKCGCKFKIEKKYVDIANKLDRYISCPLGHMDIQTEGIHQFSKESIRKIMEERKAVEL